MTNLSQIALFFRFIKYYEKLRKWKNIQIKFREIDLLLHFTSFLAWTFFKFSGLLCEGDRMKRDFLFYATNSLGVGFFSLHTWVLAKNAK